MNVPVCRSPHSDVSFFTWLQVSRTPEEICNEKLTSHCSRLKQKIKTYKKWMKRLEENEKKNHWEEMQNETIRVTNKKILVCFRRQKTSRNGVEKYQQWLRQLLLYLLIDFSHAAFHSVEMAYFHHLFWLISPETTSMGS